MPQTPTQAWNFLSNVSMPTHLGVVLPVEVRLEAAFEPPGAVVVLGAVVIETRVVVPVPRAEGLVVVVLTQRQGVSRVTLVPMHM